MITKGDNGYLTRLQKVGLDINKRDYNGNTLFYKILNKPSWIFVDKFKSLMKHFEDVNVGGTKWISLLEANRRQIRDKEDIDKPFGMPDMFLLPYYKDIWSEVRKHIRRHSI